MNFVWDGRTYDTSEMRAFQAGAQTVYVTTDQVVFVQTMDRWTGVKIHRADAEEIRYLTEQYGVVELLTVLASAREPMT